MTGGTIRVASQKPVSVDPVAMQDLGGYGITAQCFEFLCTLDPNGTRHRARAGPEVDAERGRHGLDVQPPPASRGKGRVAVHRR